VAVTTGVHREEKNYILSDIVVKFGRIEKSTVVYLLLVKQCYYWRFLTEQRGIVRSVTSELRLVR
jgi:hypothetical protein